MPDFSNNSATSGQRGEEWFRRSFDDFYLQLYVHRDDVEAGRLVETLSRRYALRGRVLDVASGAGRFLRALSSRGLEAVGLDLSAPLLRETIRSFRPATPRLIRADMRQLPVRGAWADWALLLFTSFGYFDLPEEDRLVLAELSRVLKPGGRLLLDYFNPKTTVRDLVPESWRDVSGRRVRESRRVDPSGPFLRKRIELEATIENPAVVYEERVRLYSPEELRALLQETGLRLEETWGDYEAAPFVPDRSARCLLVARKGDA